MKLLKLLILAAFTAVTLSSISGCASMQNMIVENSIEGTKGSEDSKKVAAFEKKFTQVLEDIKKKDGYKKLPLEDEEDLAWFINLSFKLWDKQISKAEYITVGEKKFPGYKETFEYLADEFRK